MGLGRLSRQGLLSLEPEDGDEAPHVGLDSHNGLQALKPPPVHVGHEESLDFMAESMIPRGTALSDLGRDDMMAAVSPSE